MHPASGTQGSSPGKAFSRFWMTCTSRRTRNEPWMCCTSPKRVCRGMPTCRSTSAKPGPGMPRGRSRRDWSRRSRPGRMASRVGEGTGACRRRNKDRSLWGHPRVHRRHVGRGPRQTCGLVRTCKTCSARGYCCSSVAPLVGFISCAQSRQRTRLPSQLRMMKRCWSAWADCSRGRIPRLRYRQPARSGRACHSAWGGWGCRRLPRIGTRRILGVLGGHHRGAQGVPPAGAGGLAAPDARRGICRAAQHQGGKVRGCMAAPAGA